MMPDTMYYCTKENNDCPKRSECGRYVNSDSHTSKATLFKNACTDDNNRILFIDVSDNDSAKEDDSTEQTT